MSFQSGSITFRRYELQGEIPKSIDEVLLTKVRDHALKPSELGAPEEVEYGWCGGQHVLDQTFSFEHNVFAECLLIAIQIDTNKVPAALKKAYQLVEEEAFAKGNPSGFISKAQKRTARENVAQRVEEDRRQGKYRRSKIVPVLFDFTHKVLYTPASNSVLEKLMEITERTFGLALNPLTSGSIADEYISRKYGRNVYEDLRPTRFVLGPDGEGSHPEYPWIAKGAQPKDFLGNEFLSWLWFKTDTGSGTININIPPFNGEISLFFDKSLDLDCAYGQTGKSSVRGEGTTRQPESLLALKQGKVPRKAYLIADMAGEQFSFNFDPERFQFGSAKLPDVEDAETPRVLFEARLGLLNDLANGMGSLFKHFLDIRASSAWAGEVAKIRRWEEK